VKQPTRHTRPPLSRSLIYLPRIS